MQPKFIYIIHSIPSSSHGTMLEGDFPKYHACTNLMAVYKFLNSLTFDGPYDLKGYSNFYKEFNAAQLYRFAHNSTFYYIAKVCVNQRMAYPFCFQ